MTPSTPSPTIRRHSQTGGWVTQTLIPEFLAPYNYGPGLRCRKFGSLHYVLCGLLCSSDLTEFADKVFLASCYFCCFMSSSMLPRHCCRRRRWSRKSSKRNAVCNAFHCQKTSSNPFRFILHGLTIFAATTRIVVFQYSNTALSVVEPEIIETAKGTRRRRRPPCLNLRIPCSAGTDIFSSCPLKQMYRRPCAMLSLSSIANQRRERQKWICNSFPLRALADCTYDNNHEHFTFLLGVAIKRVSNIAKWSNMPR